MSVARLPVELELRHLRALIALAEEGTFTDAAIELGLSQPAVSRAMAQLERILAVELVQRTTRSVRLTDAGSAAYRAAVAALEAVSSVADAARGRGRPLRLGYAWAALGRHTTGIVRAWREEHPETALELHRIDGRSAGLDQGLVDIAVRRGTVGDDGVRVDPLFDEGRLAAVPAGSALAGRLSVTLSDLVDEVVALAPGTGTTTLELWPVDARPSRVIEVDNTDDWLLAIASGEAVGVTPESTPTHHQHPGVRFVPLPEASPLTVSLVSPLHARHRAVEAFVSLAHRCITAFPDPIE